jgi:hypothetical protein
MCIAVVVRSQDGCVVVVVRIKDGCVAVLGVRSGV